MHGFTRSHYFSSKIVLTMKTVLRYSLYTLCASLVLMACKKDQKTVPIQLLLTDISIFKLVGFNLKSKN